jgi:hypothetical protein
MPRPVVGSMFRIQAMASAVSAAGTVCWGGHLNVRPVLEVSLASVFCVANHDIKSAKLCTGKLRFISSSGPSIGVGRARQNVVQKVLPSTAVMKLSATRNLPVKGRRFPACATVTITTISGAPQSQAAFGVTLSRRKPLSCLLFRRSCWHYLF